MVRNAKNGVNVRDFYYFQKNRNFSNIFGHL